MFINFYIDYGDSSFKVLEYIYELQRKCGPEKIVVLKGNHEAMLLEWIDEYKNVKSIGGFSLSFNLWLRNDIESGYMTFRTFVSSQELEEIDGIAQKADFDQTNVAAVKILLKKHGDLIRWIRKLPCYYETESSIFVHAGIDEDLGKDWSIGTSEDIS